MNRFQKFMYNKYGMDELNLVLLWIGIVMCILSLFIDNAIIGLLVGYLPFGFLLFRMLSKNYAVRRKENDKFLSYVYPIRKKFRKLKNRFKNSKNYKYFKCPNCKQELRVPKGKGNIEITCPRCKVHFDAKS
ncbi:MAG: hypothetical protein IKM20_05585 [Erysipelotrichales bacterium]|nr:hypothetical protein [Erysipelotrichales bacterium]